MDGLCRGGRSEQSWLVASEMRESAATQTTARETLDLAVVAPRRTSRCTRYQSEPKLVLLGQETKTAAADRCSSSCSALAFAAMLEGEAERTERSRGIMARNGGTAGGESATHKQNECFLMRDLH